MKYFLRISYERLLKQSGTSENSDRDLLLRDFVRLVRSRCVVREIGDKGQPLADKFDAIFRLLLIFRDLPMKVVLLLSLCFQAFQVTNAGDGSILILGDSWASISGEVLSNVCGPGTKARNAQNDAKAGSTQSLL